MKRALQWFWLALALAALGGAGCSTTSDHENISSRPWNTPRGFDTGIPGFSPEIGR
jgi:hypothetical protein